MSDNAKTSNSAVRQLFGDKRHKQARYLSQAVQLEEAVNPRLVQSTMTIVSTAILVFLVWSGFARINEIARTPGEVIPHGYQQSVQHLEGGIVHEIAVRDGDVVEQGQVLVTIRDAAIQEDMQLAAGRQVMLEMQAERLRASLEGRDADFSRFADASQSTIADQKSFFGDARVARGAEIRIIRDQITQRQQAIAMLQSDLEVPRENLKITEDLFARMSELGTKGYVPKRQLLEEQRRLNSLRGDVRKLENKLLVAKTDINAARHRLDSLNAGHRDNANGQLDQVMREIGQNKEVVDKLNERIGRLQIKAPSRGFIKGITVNTVGAVIPPGHTLMEIVPLDKRLEVEVKISPQDIGHVKIGQDVQVKFSTYDFSRYGFVSGTLQRISATTFSGAGGERFYRGYIDLVQGHVGSDSKNLIMPGMTVTADVITGQKTILQYLLKPIHISLKTAFTER